MSAVAEESSCFSNDSEKDEGSGLTSQMQEIQLTGSDEEHIHFINSKNVTVIPSSSSLRNSGSNRVKINNLVDFSWDRKYYYGHLVASTQSGNFIAYALFITKTSSGVVRVVKSKTDERILIKTHQGHIKDLAFAFTKIPTLASIDEYGGVLVHSIEEDRNQLSLKLILCLNRGDVSPSNYHMLFWCPYIPEPEDNPEFSDVSCAEDHPSMFLAMTHDCEVEVVNVNVLTQKYGSTTINTKTLPVNFKMVIEHEKPITVATISPDGSAIATGGLEGEIKFFQVSPELEGKSPGCLHRWVPHEGRPVSSLFFLDNWKQPQPDLQFWKFALTGANYNRELKLWSCESWQCLQTIRFEPRDSDIVMRAEIDASSQYLLLSDVYNKAIYVLQISQDVLHSKAMICSIAEFSVTHSILSLTVTDANKCLIKMTDEIEPSEKNGNEHNGNGEDDDELPDNVPVKGTLIKCFWINVKSLQRIRITYQPSLAISNQNSDDTISLMSHDSILYRDRLSDLSSDLHDLNSNTSLLDKEVPVHGDPELALPMELTSTPRCQGIITDVFVSGDYTSPNKVKETCVLSPSSVPLTIDPTEILDTMSSSNKLLFGIVSPKVEESSTSETGPPSRRKSSQRSSASSPSQEVADILAPVKGAESVKLEGHEEVNSHGSIDGSKTNGITSASSPNAKNELSNLESCKDQTEFVSWPQAPDLSKEYRITRRISLDKESAYANKEQLESFGESSCDAEVKAVILNIQQALESLNRNIFSIKNSHSDQIGTDIKSLQQTVCKLQIQQQNLQQKIDKDYISLCNHIQKTVSSQAQIDYIKMESLFAKKQEMDKQFLQKQAMDASQCVSSIVANNLDKAIKVEMKNSVIPGITKVIDSWKDQVQQDFVQRMSISETGIKESMKMLLKNKNFIDNVSQNVATCIQPQIQIACRELFQQNLVPNVEKVCQSLFLQLSDSFKTGTKEYLQQSQSYVEHSTQEMQGSIESTRCKFQEMMVAQVAANDALIQTARGQLQLNLEESWSRISSSLMKDIRKIITEEVRLALKEHDVSGDSHFVDGITHSRMMTPVPQQFDPQLLKQQILNYIRTGQHNSAFQEALNCKEIPVLLFTCENVAPEVVLAPGLCKLSHNVLVAMTYQLASCISLNTELTIRYIQGVLLHLHPEESVNQNLLKKAVTALVTGLAYFSQTNPSSPFSAQVQILTMAAKNLFSS